MRRGHDIPRESQVEGELYFPSISEYTTGQHTVRVWDETDDNAEPSFVMAVYDNSGEYVYCESFGNLCHAAQAFVTICYLYYREDRSQQEAEEDSWAEWGDMNVHGEDS